MGESKTRPSPRPRTRLQALGQSDTFCPDAFGAYVHQRCSEAFSLAIRPGCGGLREGSRFGHGGTAMKKSPYCLSTSDPCPGVRAFFLAGAVCLALAVAALASFACSPEAGHERHAVPAASHR